MQWINSPSKNKLILFNSAYDTRLNFRIRLTLYSFNSNEKRWQHTNSDLTHLATDPMHKRMDFQSLVHHDGKYLKSGWEKFYEKSHIKYIWNDIYYKNVKLGGCPQKLKSNSLHSNLLYVHIYANTFVSYMLLLCSINYFNGLKYISNQQILFNIYDAFLFTLFSPTCFGQYSSHIEGDNIIKRKHTYKCGCVTITP